MAKKAPVAAGGLVPDNPDIPRPRLSKLTIKNFRCIGSQPVEIELDDIVILVGPNNVGKSSILRAYEVVMSHGSKEGNLDLNDFPNGCVKPEALPEIELHTVVYDNTPGERWITENEKNEKVVREKWSWAAPGAPKRQGFDVQKNDWDEQVPWGAPNVANTRRPQPHRVDAFANPQTQATEIVNILQSILQDRLKGIKADAKKVVEGEEKSEYTILLEKIGELQKNIVAESKAEIEKIEEEVSKQIAEVFPGYIINFDARPEDDLEKCINLFKVDPQLTMGHKEGFQSTIDRQGSGARRTLLWSALRIVSENKKDVGTRPHVLLLDEPELCLHPSAIREACRVLYDLPKTGNWQVMVTTHSPAFIDVSRDNTTIIRVELSEDGVIQGTTVFRPERVKLDDDDRTRLKLLNLCDPYVSEFFFGGRSIIVEGDTEFTAFKYVINSHPEEFKDIHVIRARGKATIVSLVKILNHFGSGYSVLHDSDTPMVTTKRTKKVMKNPAWSTNNNILFAVNSHPEGVKVRLLASLPNFEGAFFGEEVEDEKPYNALIKLSENGGAFQKIVDLLRALVNHELAPPEGCLEWNEIKQLEEAVKD